MKQTSYLGKVFTYDDVISAMEKFDTELRATFPQKRWVTYCIKYDNKVYPPKQIMRLITGRQKVGSGGKPLNARFEELGFTVSYLDEVEGVEVLDNPAESEETETVFSLEVDMENSLVTNLEQLENGLRLYKEGNITGQQVVTKAVGRIDLLAIDKNSNFVVIELKAGEADREVCGQIQAYMGWIKENLARGKEVRGIIVASDFTVRTVYAAKVVPNLILKKYQIKFSFSDA